MGSEKKSLPFLEGTKLSNMSEILMELLCPYATITNRHF